MTQFFHEKPSTDPQAWHIHTGCKLVLNTRVCERVCARARVNVCACVCDLLLLVHVDFVMPAACPCYIFFLLLLLLLLLLLIIDVHNAFAYLLVDLREWRRFQTALCTNDI